MSLPFWGNVEDRDFVLPYIDAMLSCIDWFIAVLVDAAD